MSKTIFWGATLLMAILQQISTFGVLTLWPASVHSERFFSGIPVWAAWSIALLIGWYLLKIQKIRMNTALVVSGLASNMATYLFRGHFVDYIPTGLSYINLEDASIIVATSAEAFGSFQ
jgi:hypothetical protein